MSLEKELNLDFKLSTFINENPIVVKFKDVTKTIHFNNKITKIELNNSKDIFDTSTNFKPKIKKINDDEIEVNVCLYVNTPLPILIQFIGSILQVSMIDVYIDLPKVLHSNSDFPFHIYSQYLCIGKNKLTLRSNSNLLTNYGDYSEDFIKWYTSINNYIYGIVEKPLKSISFTHNISNIELICYCKQNIYVDLIELYNYHSSLYKFKRIVIHDVKLDDYYSSTKVQYIKNARDYGVSTKHVEGKQNTLTLNYLINISEEITLDTIDIFHDGTFKLNFNINSNLSEETLINSINDYVKENLDQLLDDLLIKHCAYPIDSNEINNVKNPLSIKDYIIRFSKFKAVYLIPNIDPKNIKKINTILTLENAESRFASNTSLSLIAHPFINEHIIYNLYTNYKSYKILNENMTKINIIPEIHFTFSGSNLTIFCNKFYSLDELKFELSFILPLIDYGNISKGIDKDATPVDVILSRLRSIPVKQNLKQLIAADPELFGPRKVSRNYRAYSALCQNKEQRPSIITNTEYDILKEAIPNSVIKLRNQTFPDQYVNIACPYEKFPILNFHHFNNQKCIVRCTTKQTNPGQYNNCASELGANIIQTSHLTHQSNNIIKYNDNLPLSRHCFLPQELQEIFSDYVCINFKSISKDTDIKDYVRRIFKAMTLIIRRNNNNKEYEIISDFDSTNNMQYVLIIEPETNPHLKYLVIHITTFQPLFINDYKQFYDFIKHSYKSSKINSNIMEHLNKILHLNISTELSMHQFITEIINKGYKLIIKDDNIIALLLNDILFVTPSISYPYKQPGLYFNNDYMIKTIRTSGIKYPKLSDFKLDDNDKYCVDSITNKITGIFWHYDEEYTLMMTEPEEINEQNIKQLKIYDTSNYMELLMNESPIDWIKLKNKMSGELIMKKIFIKLLKRYVELNGKIEIDEFIKFCKEYGIVGNFETTYVKRTSLLYDLYLTKINENEFRDFIKINKIIFDETLDDILYENVIRDLRLDCDDKEIVISKQFI